MPALLEGLKLSSKAAHVGFDWPRLMGFSRSWTKRPEELRREVERIPAPGPQPVGRGVAGARGSAVRSRVAGALAGRGGRSAVYGGEPGAVSGGGSGAGAAADEPEIPAQIWAGGTAHERSRKELGEASLEEMEQHWQDAKGSE